MLRRLVAIAKTVHDVIHAVLLAVLLGLVAMVLAVNVDVGTAGVLDAHRAGPPSGSPEKWRSQVEGRETELAGGPIAILRGRRQRTGSPGTVGQNWGYQAIPERAQEDRRC
jgi:hypothetical protein